MKKLNTSIYLGAFLLYFALPVAFGQQDILHDMEHAYKTTLSKIEGLEGRNRKDAEIHILDLGNEIIFRSIAYNLHDNGNDNSEPFVQSFYNIYVAELHRIRLGLEQHPEDSKYTVRFNQIFDKLLYSYPISIEHSKYEGIMLTKILSEYANYINDEQFEVLHEKFINTNGLNGYPIYIYLSQVTDQLPFGKLDLIGKLELNENNKKYLEKLKIVFNTYYKDSKIDTDGTMQ